ncbi:UDP-N-acetylmuramoyl-L-alanyl-D-glutamate--2,6-diaminopimelate ligase [Alloiococcus sp. CFN-8]|uniref:UDP-N-acetylmuramoyl-L-alanyl-D-glutamate--2, 6-diaminopimelate ligase n=1 Tax=Alloiococcus sp. CFN-8 TaxID=3416081 RepID=UPI003CE81A06
MKIRDLLQNIDYEIIQGSDQEDIKNISWDSRNVGESALFICVRGANVDRHDYAHTAIEEGAIALIVEKEMSSIPKNIALIKVKDSKAVMATLASEFYEKPSKKFNLIGITGTNGKTSTSYFITEVLESLGRTVGIIGTIENRLGGKKLTTEKKNPTTPDSIELQASFNEMVKNNVTDVVMEVTSIGLVEHRVDESDFNIGVFTNLTQDHLDYHKTMENYRDAKLKLFDLCKKGLINIDDPYGEDFVKGAACDTFTYGAIKEADYRAVNIKYSLDGVDFTLVHEGREYPVALSIPGKFTVYNALAAIGTCHLSGFALEDIIRAIKSVKTVRGRFESVPNDKGYLVVVDYAHTPDGLENILSSVKELAEKRVISVFGCGGDRDRTKRPIMGEISGRLADLSIITSDNPRTEDPDRILEDITAGIIKTGSKFITEVDRRKAIHMALDTAEKGDIIVIAGKGHETYQIFKDKTIHFDDVEVVKEYINK